MKRTLSLSFLLIANIVVLAHAVIPHHYHNQIPDITWSALQKNNDSHTANQCTDSNCPIHRVEEDCFLKKIGVRFDSKGLMLSTVDADFELFPCLVSLFSVIRIAEIDDLESLPFNQKPYLRFSHTDFIARSSGLRAPPVF